jgi:hypothetical protein
MVIATKLNCREYPSTDSEILAYLEEGDVVNIYGHLVNSDSEKWDLSSVDEDEPAPGWISGKFVELFE